MHGRLDQVVPRASVAGARACVRVLMRGNLAGKSMLLIGPAPSFGHLGRPELAGLAVPVLMWRTLWRSLRVIVSAVLFTSAVQRVVVAGLRAARFPHPLLPIAGPSVFRRAASGNCQPRRSTPAPFALLQELAQPADAWSTSL